jgi:hypothetical protein
MRLRHALAATGAVVGATLAANVAFAAWNSSGTGSGTAQATSAVALTTTAAATTTAQLFPGGSGDLKITVKNDNGYPVRVSDVTGSAAITSDKGAACDASTGVMFTDQHGQALDVPANSSATFTLSGVMHMSNASDNSCQSAVFTIPVSLTGASHAA